MIKPISVNFFGGPSSGKSTSAKWISAELNDRAANVEYVSEYAKALVYRGALEKFRNQLYIFAKQYKMMKDTTDYGVPMILTDSPLLLSLIYGKGYCEPSFQSMVRQMNDEFENVNVFVRRVKPYNPVGRLQDEAGSDAISKALREDMGIVYDYTIDGNRAGRELLTQQLFDRFKDRITT